VQELSLLGRESLMKRSTGGAPPLSPHWAFVVQFREDTNVAQGRFTGRVEHVVLGHSKRFQSLEELLAFIAHMLSTGEESSK